jgi:hypothetical protein
MYSTWRCSPPKLRSLAKLAVPDVGVSPVTLPPDEEEDDEEPPPDEEAVPPEEEEEEDVAPPDDEEDELPDEDDELPEDEEDPPEDDEPPVSCAPLVVDPDADEPPEQAASSAHSSKADGRTNRSSTWIRAIEMLLCVPRVRLVYRGIWTKYVRCRW